MDFPSLFFSVCLHIPYQPTSRVMSSLSVLSTAAMKNRDAYRLYTTYKAWRGEHSGVS